MVQILDTTLREGEQTPGVYFDTHVKIAIANLLDRLGVDYIEAGHPAVTDEIEQVVRQLSNQGMNVTIGAHSRSLRGDVDRAIECGVGFLGIFYCVSNDRLEGVFKRTLDSAVDQITDVIGYAKDQDPDLMIRYTPEDTVRSNFDNVVTASAAAVRAGADIISIADTTGYMIPGTDRSMYDYVRKLRQEMDLHGLNPMIAVHCHNDRGLALANALDGYRAGADIIDASVLGLGERAGIVDIAQLLVSLSVDFHEETDRWNLELLPELYRLVSRFSGIPIPSTFPITGLNAFRHCAGMHTHAVVKDPLHYHSLDPSIVGRSTEICLDHMAGTTSIEYAMRRMGFEPDNELVAKVTGHVKAVGRKGRTVDEEELKIITEMYRERTVKDDDTPAQVRGRKAIVGRQVFQKGNQGCFLQNLASEMQETDGGACTIL